VELLRADAQASDHPQVLQTIVAVLVKVGKVFSDAAKILRRHLF
jgi:hypothetical protein